MSHPTLPLLPPPPPRFPQTFNVQDEDTSSVGFNDSHLAEMHEVERRGEENRRVWGIKTEAEEHVQKLEDRLSQLSNRQTRTESPVAGRPPELAEPDLSQIEDYSGTTGYGFEDEPNLENGKFEGEEQEGEAVGHEDEGRALLSIAEASTEEANGVDDEEQSNEADLSGNDEENLTSKQPPHPFENMTAAQRISFSNSVRISGGIHTRPHRHRSAIEAFSRRSPSNERSNPISSRDPRPETAPSPLLVASVTSSNVNSPSRATSPSGRTSAHSSSSLNVLAPKPRRLSSSSHLSSNFNHAAYTYYSASPGSQVPSRGSSPCSSIYAPLQPPSKHTPNPLFVRPSPRLQRQRSGSSGLSFQEYLREGYDAFDESDDDSDAISGGPKSPGYRELVEQQRRKRAQWEERKRRRIEDKRRKLNEENDDGSKDTKSGFWSGFKRFFAVGTSGNANAFGTGVGRAGGSFGSPTVFRSSSRLPTNANYGATRQTPKASPPAPSPLAPTAPKPRSILTSSQLPPSSSGPLPEYTERPPRTRSRSRSNSATPPHPPSPPDKTELDARFGTSPLRFFTLSFILYKLESFLAAVKDLFSTASKGLAKQKERERLARQRQEGGYQAV